MLSPQVLSFLVVGAIAAACNFGSRIVFSLFAPYAVAVVLAFTVGLMTAFWLNRRFVFRSNGPVLRQFGLFFAVNLFALLQTVAVSLLMLHWLLPLIGWSWHAAEVAHAAGVAAPLITSYFGHKHVTFRTP